MTTWTLGVATITFVLGIGFGAWLLQHVDATACAMCDLLTGDPWMICDGCLEQAIGDSIELGNSIEHHPSNRRPA